MSGDLIAGLATVAVLLGGCFVAIVRQRRNGNGHEEFREDIKYIRKSVDGLKATMGDVVTKVAVHEHRIGALERRAEHEA